METSDEKMEIYRLGCLNVKHFFDPRRAPLTVGSEAPVSLYFIRHGESVSNEQNLFAGRVDTPLTALGRRQALQAKAKIQKLEVKLTEVHVSPLSRAFDTAQIVVEDLNLPVVVAPELVERDFGKLSEQNKSLIKKYFGAKKFEHMFHAHDGVAPGGETFMAMYERIRDYYETILRPKSEAGAVILVVAHKYIIEMFALIAINGRPEDYQDFRIPNSKPCSMEDLKRIAKSASPHMNSLAENVEATLPGLLLLSGALGWLLKLAIGIALPTMAFTSLTAVLLSINSFMSLLRLEPKTVMSAPGSLRQTWKGYLGRTTLGLACVFAFESSWIQAFGLFLLLPSAMTAPTFSLMWGGDYFLSVQGTLVTSVLSPLVVGLIAWVGVPGLSLHVGSYFLLLGLSVLLPGLIAQSWRAKRPIEAGALSTNWGWIGGAAILPLAAISVYQFAPMHFEMGGTQLLMQVGYAAALFAAIRLIGVLAARFTSGNSRLKRDVYINHVVPNVFFWFALLPIDSDFAMMRLWVTLLFFISIFFEERRFVAEFPLAAKLTKSRREVSQLVGVSD